MEEPSKTVISSAARAILVIAIAGLAWPLAGCKDASRQPGARVRAVTVRAVTDQGLTLDQDADPEEVVYVLLRAIKDDYAAGDDAAARDAAYERQLAVCAPAHIHKASLRGTLTLEENVYHIVWHWAPTLGHYRHNFEFDWPAARDRMRLDMIPPNQNRSTEEIARVSMELADPSGEPDASVIAQIELVREQGFWRVLQLGFAKGARHLEAPGVSKSTTG